MAGGVGITEPSIGRSVKLVAGPDGEVSIVLVGRALPLRALAGAHADAERAGRLAVSRPPADRTERPAGAARVCWLDLLELALGSGVSGPLGPALGSRGPDHEHPVLVLSDPVVGVLLIAFDFVRELATSGQHLTREGLRKYDENPLTDRRMYYAVCRLIEAQKLRLANRGEVHLPEVRSEEP